MASNRLAIRYETRVFKFGSFRSENRPTPICLRQQHPVDLMDDAVVGNCVRRGDLGLVYADTLARIVGIDLDILATFFIC